MTLPIGPHTPVTPSDTPELNEYGLDPDQAAEFDEMLTKSVASSMQQSMGAMKTEMEKLNNPEEDEDDPDADEPL